MRLVFIRSSCACHCENYYEKATEVVVFGDQDGYRRLVQSLNLAASGKRPHDLNELRPRGAKGMDVLVLPAERDRGLGARVKLVERPIPVGKRKLMQLIVYGSSSGLRRLALAVGEMLGRKGATVDDHIHIDHHDTDYVVAPSVWLNIRGPLNSFSKQALGPYSALLFGANPDAFPSDLEYFKFSAKSSKRPDVTSEFFSLGHNRVP